MSRFRYVAVMTALMVAGCSKTPEQVNNSAIGNETPAATEAAPKTASIAANPAELLLSGDPHACAADSVKSSLFETVKQHAINPYQNSGLPLNDPSYQEALSKVEIAANSITSTAVDQVTHKITCNATINMKADGSDKEYNQSVDYELSPNLVQDGDVSIKVDTTVTQGQVGALLIDAAFKISHPNGN